MVCEIQLTQGKAALVDDEDYRHLLGFNWHYAGGYARAAYGNGHIFMHVYLMKPPPNTLVDHKDQNKLNNQKANLRFATNQQNTVNVKKQKGVSRYKGVVWDSSKNKWKAQIKVNGKNKNLGRFAEEADAARAYDAAAVKEFGEYASLNFPSTISKTDIV